MEDVYEKTGQIAAPTSDLTPYREIEFDQADAPTPDEIEQAQRDLVRLRLSLGGRGDSFSFTLHRVRRGMADVVSGYLSTIDEQLPLIVQRLRSVQIVNRPALDVISALGTAPRRFLLCTRVGGRLFSTSPTTLPVATQRRGSKKPSG